MFPEDRATPTATPTATRAVEEGRARALPLASWWAVADTTKVF